MNSPPSRLTVAKVERAAAELAERDPDLGRAAERLGPPPLWDRPPGFATLVHIILEQQVSLASARAAMSKLEGAVPDLSPGGFLKLDDHELRAIGFSAQKGRYCRGLASALREGRLDLHGLARLPDNQAGAELEKIGGIGPWTSCIYLLMVLLRPDVLPPNDLALCKAIQDLKGLERPPSRDRFEAIAEAWRPWRSVAARILWNHYLNPE